MRALPQFALSLATILLCAGVTAGADLESVQRAYQQEDDATALQDATALAKQGQAGAQVLLGRMDLTGRGAPKDPDTALKWFKAAAVQGDADGAFLVGAMYFLPRSDIPEGLHWVRLAAERGNQDPQLQLGLRLRRHRAPAAVRSYLVRPRMDAGWPGSEKRLPVSVTSVPSTRRMETSRVV
jgi:TPR repeat protein